MVKPGISTCRAYTPFRIENEWFAVYKLQLVTKQLDHVQNFKFNVIQCYVLPYSWQSYWEA